jgi:hypothetical protein
MIDEFDDETRSSGHRTGTPSVTLSHVGGGVHAVAVRVRDRAPAETDDPFVVNVIEADDDAVDEFALVEQERVRALAAGWLDTHGRELRASAAGLVAGTRLIAAVTPGPRRWTRSVPFRARWTVTRHGRVERLDEPLVVPDDVLRPVPVLDARAPGGADDAADLALFCGTIATTLGLTATVAVAGDIYEDRVEPADRLAAGNLPPAVAAPTPPPGHVWIGAGSPPTWPTGADDPLVPDMAATVREAVAQSPVDHLMISSASGYLPGRGDGVHLWCAASVHEAAGALLDLNAGEVTQRVIDPVQRPAAAQWATRHRWLLLHLSWLLSVGAVVAGSRVAVVGAIAFFVVAIAVYGIVPRVGGLRRRRRTDGR